MRSGRRRRGGEGERDEGIKVVDTLVPLPDCEMTLKMLIYSPVHPSLLHLTPLLSISLHVGL